MMMVKGPYRVLQPLPLLDDVDELGGRNTDAVRDVAVGGVLNLGGLLDKRRRGRRDRDKKRGARDRWRDLCTTCEAKSSKKDDRS